VYIRLDREFEIYDRKVGNFLSMLSDVGGL
jgi:hypothetical protein